MRGHKSGPFWIEALLRVHSERHDGSAVLLVMAQTAPMRSCDTKHRVR
jgi:hypothetical protein